MVNGRANFIISNAVILIYVLGALLAKNFYDIYHPISLISIFVLILFTISAHVSGKIKINIFLSIFVLYHIIIGMAYGNSEDFASMLLYTILVYAISQVSQYTNIAHLLFTHCIVVMNYINFLSLLFLPVFYTRFKFIGSIPIKIKYFEGLSFSSASLTALLAFILIFYLNQKKIYNKFIVITTLFSCFYVILTLGKLSVLLALAFSLFISKLIQAKVLKPEIISKLFLSFSLLLAWILPMLINLTSKWHINYHALSSRRDSIWMTYLEFYKNSALSEKMFGSFLIEAYDNNLISLGIEHPHNQWIFILISTGIVGILLYYILYLKAYRFTISNRDQVGYTALMAINVYTIFDDYVLLTVGCVYSFLIFYFAFQKQKPSGSGRRALK